MGKFWKLLLVALALVSLIGGWLWWNRPQKVDMSAYVPAESIIYIEANDLPQILNDLTSTDAWQELAPHAGLDSDFSKIKLLSRLASWTGIGPAEAVVLSRAQIAATILSFDAAEDSAETLKITPRAALVVETHSGESRAIAALEKLAGDFARRIYSSPRVERKEVNGVAFITWSPPMDSKRRIVAAVSESVIVIGNNEATVEACLAAQRGERAALIDNTDLVKMREQLSSNDALTFGFIPSGNAAKILEVALLPYVGQLSLNQRTQSVVASLLPQLTNKIFGMAAWTTRINNRRTEDRYFIGLQPGLSTQLHNTLKPSNEPEHKSDELLPADTYQITHYNFDEPEAAWRGLNAAIASQLDALSAPFVSIALNEALKPYGIESSREFLRAAGLGITIARLDDKGSSTVVVAPVRDRELLREQVRKRIGPTAQTVRIGDAELITSAKTGAKRESIAASFVSGYLIMGNEESVRRCLSARERGQTLAVNPDFKRASELATTNSTSLVTTFTDDEESARSFVTFLAREHGAKTSDADREKFEQALTKQAYAVTETELIDDGFMRKTHSSFGQFGLFISLFTMNNNEEVTSDK